MTAEQLEELLSDLAHDGKFRRDAARDDLAALAPTLARRVIAAEKLVEALDELPLGDGPLAQLVTAYRESSK